MPLFAEHSLWFHIVQVGRTRRHSSTNHLSSSSVWPCVCACVYRDCLWEVNDCFIYDDDNVYKTHLLFGNSGRDAVANAVWQTMPSRLRLSYTCTTGRFTINAFVPVRTCMQVNAVVDTRLFVRPIFVYGVLVNNIKAIDSERLHIAAYMDYGRDNEYSLFTSMYIYMCVECAACSSQASKSSIHCVCTLNAPLEHISWYSFCILNNNNFCPN